MSLWSRLERRINDLADGLVLDDYRDQLVSARQLVSEGKLPQAIEVLEALLRAKPDHGQALIELGEALMAAREPLRARAAFEKAVAARPGDPAGLVGLGLALVVLGSYEPAIAPLGRAISEAAGDRQILAAAYRGLGVAWRRRGDLDKAIRELRKAVAEDGADVDARAQLGEALVADGGPYDEALRHLERVASPADAAPAMALYALGRLALIEGTPALAEARLAAARARLGDAAASPLDQALRFDVLIAQGDAALAAADAVRSHGFYLEALQLEPKRIDVHARIASAHRSIGNLDAALASYDRVLGAGDVVLEVLRAAVDTAIAAGDAARELAWGNDLLARAPDDVRALVARGAAMMATQPQDARTYLDLAAARDDVDAHVLLAQLALGGHEPGRAAACALAALRVAPHHARARQLLADARAAEVPAPASPDIAELARYVEHVMASRRELGHFVGDVARAAGNLDSPLLVTVMGEFSSGKSSFVNAFIGADVAPTGITPTTATINVVRYGRERGGRIVARDGTALELGWDALMAHLRALTPAAASAIERVEILVPLPQLEKIHIVDTPGLNSIQPEHEATARAFIARADAVVWVFTASQGGKASEKKALASIQAEGKRVLGVLNKADQLTAEDTAEVITFITGELGELVETIVPVSARRALAWKRDPACKDGDGNWRALTGALEERFFAQARQLKRDACARILRNVTAEASAVIAASRGRAEEAAAAARVARDDLTASARRFTLETVIAERKALSEHTVLLYRRAAREVLDLVRPRRLPFAAHSATAADRDYLVALLSSGFEAAIEGGRARVATDLLARSRTGEAAARAMGAALGVDVLGDLERVASDRIGLALSRVFDRTRAYVLGYLEGGHVDAFFRNDVPRLELAEDAVYHALFRASPNLDRELGEPLERAAGEALAALARRIDHWGAVVDVQAFDLEVGIGRALEVAASRL